jgi:Myb-like DNA-binding domain
MNLRKRRRLHNPHDNYLTVYMSAPSKQNSDQDAESSKRTVWSPDDEKDLVSALLKFGYGTNFRPEMWNDVASSMGKPFKGPPKTAESCKSKWARVSDSILIPSSIVDDRAIPR